MNVLSLFDGISCGMLAFQRAGIKIEEYYAYEIDQYAIKVSQKHHPQITQCGNVIGADFKQYKNKIDIVIGGSPCQDLCSMGSRKGLRGEKSKLFFEFVRALKEIQPKWFLLENNASMSKENKEIISKYLNCEPVFINSSDFSAQNRKRLYWTNIPVNNWNAKNILIKNIVEDIQNKQFFDITDKVIKYTSPEYKERKIQKTVSNKIKTLNQKSKCLGTGCGGYGNNTGLIIKYDNDRYYILTPVEAERLQTLPDNYTECIPLNKRYFVIGNAWTVDVIAHIFKGLKNS